MKKIRVSTIKTGYELCFDGQKNKGYLYHSVEDLLYGFILHIGCEVTDELELNEVKEIVKALPKYNELAPLIEKNRKLEDKNITLSTRLDDALDEKIKQRAQWAAERQKLIDTIEDYNKLLKKVKALDVAAGFKEKKAPKAMYVNKALLKSITDEDDF